MAAAEGLFLSADLGGLSDLAASSAAFMQQFAKSSTRRVSTPSSVWSGLPHSPTRRPPKLGWQITHLAETTAAASVITQMAGGHPGRADLLRRPSLINLGSLGEKTFALGKRRGLCPKVNIWYCSPNAPPRSNSGSSNTGTGTSLFK